jgi:hypothetical protein
MIYMFWNMYKRENEAISKLKDFFIRFICNIHVRSYVFVLYPVLQLHNIKYRLSNVAFFQLAIWVFGFVMYENK